MEQNITKMVTAISNRQKKMQEMESNLDSIESQTLETESEEDSSSMEGQIDNESPYPRFHTIRFSNNLSFLFIHCIILFIPCIYSLIVCNQ